MSETSALPTRLAALQSAGMVSHILHGNSAGTADAALLEKLCKHIQGPVFRLAARTYAFLIAPVPSGAAAAQVLKAMQQEFGDMDVTFAPVPPSQPAAQSSPDRPMKAALAEGATTKLLEEISGLRAGQAELAEILAPMQVILRRMEARFMDQETSDKARSAPPLHMVRQSNVDHPQPVTHTSDSATPPEDELRGILDTFLTRMHDSGTERAHTKSRA